MIWRRSLIAGGVFGVLAMIASGVIFQDNIAQFLANPRAPLQTLTPPSPPDYNRSEAWILWPHSEDAAGPADIFYVHSTTYYSNDSWNAPIDDAEADAELKRKAAPNQAGPFLNAGRIYAPRYRQATLFALFTHKFDGIAARTLAYQDVRKAFEVFVQKTDERRPIILVGYGQGGLYVQGLLQEYFQDNESLRDRLAAAYVIEHAPPLELFKKELNRTPPCEDTTDIRCVISYIDLEPQFDEEMRRFRSRAIVVNSGGDFVSSRGSQLLCINPLNWRMTDEYVSPDRHVGAASATGLKFGDTPTAIKKAVGAKCMNGILVVDSPDQGFLRRGYWFGAKWKAQHFNLFYFDLATDARRRVKNAAHRMEDEYRNLDPIEESVEVEASPINKVPIP